MSPVSIVSNQGVSGRTGTSAVTRLVHKPVLAPNAATASARRCSRPTATYTYTSRRDTLLGGAVLGASQLAADEAQATLLMLPAERLQNQYILVRIFPNPPSTRLFAVDIFGLR